jgi:[ribosomal protein S5]-alanine N-acetyltransferase
MAAMTLTAGTDSIETARLRLRRMTWDDLAFFADIHSDADVARYIGHGQPRSHAETTGWLRDILASYDASSLGQLAVIRKSDGAVIGRCGLSDAALEQTQTPGQIRKGWFFSTHAPSRTALALIPELGYTFARDCWGQGYATEAAGCVFAYAKAQRNFPEIMSVIHAENIGSRSVALKFGVQFVDKVELSGRVFDRYHWPMTEGQ